MRKKNYVLLLVALVIMSFIMVACSGNENINPSNSGGTTPDVVYIVTFNSNGGSDIAYIQAAKGEKISAPTQPTRDHYTFDGWYKDSSFASEWDFDSDVVNSNITLYAK